MQIPLIIENLIFSPLIFCIPLFIILIWPSRPARKGKRKANTKVRWVIAIWIILFILSSRGFFQLFSWPLKELTPASNKHKADIIVVATAGVHESGAPSPGSTIRAHTAAQLYLEGWAPLILVTGGVTHPYDPHIHAKGMHIILRGMGVPDENILIENQSIDTYMNSTMSTEILKARNLEKVLLVTHDYHLLRLSLVFQQTGLEIFPYAANISSAKKPPSWWQYFDWKNFNRLQTYAHEYIGLLAYKIRGWI